MYRSSLLRGASACALGVLLVASPAFGQQSLPAIDVGTGRAKPKPSTFRGQPTRGPVQAPAAQPQPQPQPKPEPIRRAIPENVPAVVESVTRQQIDKTVNVMTTAETLKYMPSVLIRERFIGDRNGVAQTRFNTPIAGAQNLVYADSILLSNLLGNSFNTPPRWGMVSPAEIDRIDVIYGPFSALYPGNSMGGLLTITTRMPEGPELHASGTGAYQNFNFYKSSEREVSGDLNILAGTKINDLSFWFGFDRLDARGQSQTFPGGSVVTGVKTGAALYGGILDFSENGSPRMVAGAAGRDHSEQNLGKFKVDYELFPKVHATYSLGFWSLIDNTSPTTYSYDQRGVPIYATGTSSARVGGVVFPFTTPLVPTHSNASHLMQGLQLKSDTKGVFDFDLSGSSYNYLRDYVNTAKSYGFMPNATSTAYTINPGGSNVNLTGSYWHTVDLRTIWRPEASPTFGKHEISAGYHNDEYSLAQTQTNTFVYTGNAYATTRLGYFPGDTKSGIQAVNLGRTITNAAYVQDVWQFLPQWRLTAGGREEFWAARYGYNNTLSQNYRPTVAGYPGYWVVVAPPELPNAHKRAFSPKGALQYDVTPDFMLRASIGRYYRFPTDLELYQNITGPGGTNSSNPQLKPENGTEYDLTAEYVARNVFGLIGEARPRVSLAMDQRWAAIYSQTDFTTGFPVSQNVNIGKAVFRAVEGAVRMKDVVIPGLDYDGSVIFTDSRTVSDYQPYLAAGAIYTGNQAPVFIQGQQAPRVPRIRIRSTVSYSLTDQYSLSMGVRYGSAAFVSLDNRDFNHNNGQYGSVDSEYLVFDLHATYKFDKNWKLTAGIDNIGNWKHFVNPNPYPQRTFFLGLKYDFGGPDEKKTTTAFVPSGLSTPAADRSDATFGGSPALR